MLQFPPNTSGDESQFLTCVYWNVWKTLINALQAEEKFSDNMIVINVDGSTESYPINDLMPSQETSGGFIDMNLYKGIVSNWEERQTYWGTSYKQRVTPLFILIVPRKRLELSRPYGHQPLKLTRLPIPPPGQGLAKLTKKIQIQSKIKHS